MKITSINIEVNEMPLSCRGSAEENGCLFCVNKYCVLKSALLQQCYVGSNYDNIPNDCPLKL